MGRRKKKIVELDQIDNSDDDSMDSGSTALSDLVLAQEMVIVDSMEFTLEKHLEALYEKRGSTRELALAGLIGAFESHVLCEFIEDRCITLLHQYLISMKRGSTKEVCLASRALGLLAITNGIGNNKQEIMDVSTPPLSRALVLGPDEVKIFALDSLAVVTFVGTCCREDTEAIMKNMWEIIHPKSRSKAGTITKPGPGVLVAALYSWTFLLTTLTAWKVDFDMWTELISFLCNLLEKGDRAVRMAAGEAIAVIFEKVIDGKFSTAADANESLDGVPSKPKWFLYLLSLKEKITKLVSNLSMEAGGKGTDKKSLNAQRDTFQKVYDYLKEGKQPESSLIVSKKQGVLTTTAWTELIKLNFLKRFLGSGFLKHAQDNELLHNVFNLIPHAESNLSTSQKRIFRSSGDRMRTQEMKKDRHLAQLRKGSLLFSTPN